MKIPVLALAALAGLSGCVLDNYASPEFVGICNNPSPDTSTGACLYSSTCNAYESGYYYDPALTTGNMVVPVELFNQLPNNADATAWRVNTNDAVIDEWRLEYMIGGVSVATGTMVTNVVIPAGSHVVALVSVSVAPMMGLPFVVNVKAAGRYLDDRTFVTGAFPVPITVGTYTPITCTTGIPEACPRSGQESTQACVTG